MIDSLVINLEKKLPFPLPDDDSDDDDIDDDDINDDDSDDDDDIDDDNDYDNDDDDDIDDDDIDDDGDDDIFKNGFRRITVTNKILTRKYTFERMYNDAET
jgi:hypothetical protein